MTDLVWAPCVDCTRHTLHEIVHNVRVPGAYYTKNYRTLQCRGCNSVSLREDSFDPNKKLSATKYHPPAISRKPPDWSIAMNFQYGEEAEKFEDLLQEIYIETQNNCPRLAIMGVRAVLEQVMIGKVGDQGTFGRNLKAFADAGYVSVVQYDALTAILDAGHAVIHRGFSPKKEHLNTALDVMEGILAALYVHDQDVKGLQIPDRPRHGS